MLERERTASDQGDMTFAAVILLISYQSVACKEEEQFVL